MVRPRILYFKLKPRIILLQFSFIITYVASNRNRQVKKIGHLSTKSDSFFLYTLLYYNWLKYSGRFHQPEAFGKVLTGYSHG